MYLSITYLWLLPRDPASKTTRHLRTPCLKDIAVTLGNDQGYSCTLLLQDRIGSHGRAMIDDLQDNIGGIWDLG